MCNNYVGRLRGFLTFSRHEAQLLTKHRVCGPPTIKLLLSDNCCTCMKHKYNKNNFS